MLNILEQNLNVVLERKHVFYVGEIALIRLFLLLEELEESNKSSVLVMNSKEIKMYF